MHDKELPLLAGIAGVLRWCEALVNLLSGPALTLAVGVAVVDIAVHGGLLGQWPWLLIAWGVCVAVGLDSQVILQFDHVGTAFREKRWGVMAGYVVIGLLLSYVAFLACAAFGLQHSLGLSEVDALSRLGIVPEAYQYERAALALLLVALSAINRYRPKQRTLAEKRAELTETLELLPLQQQVQTLRATGAVQTARAVGQAAIGKQATKPTKPRPPTGPGSPTQKPVTIDGETTADGLRLFPTVETEPQRKVARARLSLRDKVYRALLEDASLSKTQLARRFRVSESAVARYKTEFLRQQNIAQ